MKERQIKYTIVKAPFVKKKINHKVDIAEASSTGINPMQGPNKVIFDFFYDLRRTHLAIKTKVKISTLPQIIIK